MEPINWIVHEIVGLSGSETGSGGFATYGFGYEKVNGDYKVVEVVCHGQRTSVDQVKEFLMRYNCWRSIKGLPPGIVVEKYKVWCIWEWCFKL